MKGTINFEAQPLNSQNPYANSSQSYSIHFFHPHSPQHVQKLRETRTVELWMKWKQFQTNWEKKLIYAEISLVNNFHKKWKLSGYL